MLIEWEDDQNVQLSNGFIQGYNIRKYVVVLENGQLVADVELQGLGLHLDVPVNSIAEGKQLCEMWEATGAY